MSRLRSLLAGRAGLAALAVVLGVANTVVLFGWGPIDPTNLTWLFGDTATYFAGWELYRHDPRVRFPLTWTDRVGYPVGTSIALLDAIPIAAIVLRPLGALLPEPMQYLGLYSVACFVLQAYFGCRLCRRLFPSHPGFSLLGGLFFLFSAPLTNRAFGHTSLLGHWLILAGFDAYLRELDRGPVRWISRLWILVALAAGNNAYMAAMCFLMALTGVARLVVERRCGWWAATLLAAATTVVLFASLAFFGVLVGRDAGSYVAAGYGLFSLNLNALVNPMTKGSILLPELPLAHPEQYEGYAYLGLGVLALLILNVARRPRFLLRLAERRQLPLVGLALVCTALAASTSVTFGSHTLVTIAPPAPLARGLETLRASGRLFWPAYYLIVAAAIAWTFSGWNGRRRAAILAAALGLQIADLTPLRSRLREALDQRYQTPLTSAAWQGLGRRYDRLILVPPHQCGPATGAGGAYSYVWFGRLAAAERMSSNSYYASRYLASDLYAHCVDLLREQLAGRLDQRSAYVVTDGVRTVWETRGAGSQSCRQVDGFNLCTVSAAAVPQAPPASAEYRPGDTLDLTNEDDRARRYLTFGWGTALPTGTWTEGPLAVVRLGLPLADRNRALILELAAEAFVQPEHPAMDVDVFVNGQSVGQWAFRRGSPAAPPRARIPAGVTTARPSLDIEFRFRNPWPVASFVGLHVSSLAVRYE